MCSVVLQKDGRFRSKHTVAVRNPQSWVGEMDNLAEDMGLDHSTHMAAHTQPSITLVPGDPMSLHIHIHT